MPPKFKEAWGCQSYRIEFPPSPPTVEPRARALPCVILQSLQCPPHQIPTTVLPVACSPMANKPGTFLGEIIGLLKKHPHPHQRQMIDHLTTLVAYLGVHKQVNNDNVEQVIREVFKGDEVVVTMLSEAKAEGQAEAFKVLISSGAMTTDQALGYLMQITRNEAELQIAKAILLGNAQTK